MFAGDGKQSVKFQCCRGCGKSVSVFFVFKISMKSIANDIVRAIYCAVIIYTAAKYEESEVYILNINL